MSNKYNKHLSLTGVNFSQLNTTDLKKMAGIILDEKIHGISFSPYVEGQGPGTQIDEAQIRDRLDHIKSNINWIRSFSCTEGNELIPKIAKENGYKHVINYTKDDFVKEVFKITNNEGVPAVFDGVGKNTFKGSIACLKPRGTMVSFGNASGALEPLNVSKDIQSKSLFFTRPTMKDYYSNRSEVVEGAEELFKQIKSFHKYNLCA